MNPTPPQHNDPNAGDALKEVRSAIQRLVPEIMELKLGCVCEVQNYYVTIPILQDRRDWTWIPESGDVRCDFLGLAPRGQIFFDEKHIKAILGRPITLEDVLRAIQDTGVHIAFYGNNRMWFVKPTMEKFGTGRENSTWLLGKTLDDQSDELISFLRTILV